MNELMTQYALEHVQGSLVMGDGGGGRVARVREVQ